MNNYKVKKLVDKYFFNSNFNFFYFKKIKKFLKFSKNNHNFITYDLLFFFFYNFRFSDLKNTLKILNKIGIKIFEKIPEDDFFFLKEINNNFKLNGRSKNQKTYFFDNLFFKKINNIKRLEDEEIIFFYKKIKNINTISSLFINKFLNIKIFLLKSKKIFNNYIIEDTLLPFCRKYFIKNDLFKNTEQKVTFKFTTDTEEFIEKEKEFLNKFDEEEILKLENFPKIKMKKKYIFYLKIFLKILKKKNNFYFKKIFNELISLTNMSSNSINIIFNIFNKKIKKINSIKLEIYDILVNISKLSYIKYNFYFIEYGSKLDWIFNIINLNNFNKSLIKKIKNFLKKKSKILKNLENTMQMKIKKILKIFLILEINNFKINLIKKKILLSNLYIAKNICYKHFGKDFYNDVIQESIIGIIKFINNYNYKSENSFIKLAYYSARNSVSRFLYSNRLIRLPNYVITLLRLVDKVIENYKLKYNEKPTVKYISEKINMPEKKLLQIIKSSKIPIYLEKEIYEDTKLEEILSDKNQISAEKIIFNEELKKCFNKIFENLEERYVRILFMRYGMNFYKKETLQKIGDRFNLSKERIRQIQNLVLDKLRHPERSKKLKKFFTPKFK